MIECPCARSHTDPSLLITIGGCQGRNRGRHDVAAGLLGRRGCGQVSGRGGDTCCSCLTPIGPCTLAVQLARHAHSCCCGCCCYQGAGPIPHQPASNSYDLSFNLPCCVIQVREGRAVPPAIEVRGILSTCWSASLHVRRMTRASRVRPSWQWSRSSSESGYHKASSSPPSAGE